MATIRQRGNSFSVIYHYTDYAGRRRQTSILCNDKFEAEKTKQEIEFKQKQNKLITPSNRTFEQLFDEVFLFHVRRRKWEPGTYDCNVGLLKNQILPHIGNCCIQKFDSRDRDMFYDLLSRKVKKSYKEGMCVIENAILPRRTPDCLATSTIKKVHNLLHIAFSYAKKWKWIEEIPEVEDLPKPESKERNIWDETTMFEALKKMEDNPMLHLAVHLDYIGSLRVGELAAITLDNINLSEGKVFIDKTLQRVSKASLDAITNDSVYKTFPSKIQGKKSCMILKGTKTSKSKRVIFLTAPLVLEIENRLAQIEQEKALEGNFYTDNNLLFALPDGSPIEPKLFEKWFREWQRQNPAFPELIFHEIRHSSTTFKLRVSDGDIKSVQGDTGHAQADMVLNTYSHIQERSRLEMCRKVEAKFYQQGIEAQNAIPDNAATQLLELIKNNPEVQNQFLLALLTQNANSIAMSSN